jgi:hypothetical protein
VSPSAVNVVAADVSHDGVLSLTVSVKLLSFNFFLGQLVKKKKKKKRVREISGNFV